MNTTPRPGADTRTHAGSQGTLTTIGLCLAIALLEVLAIQYVSPLLSEVVPFLALLVMLCVRPWGIFGTPEEIERV